jgi:hypothetical protein
LIFYVIFYHFFLDVCFVKRSNENNKEEKDFSAKRQRLDHQPVPEQTKEKFNSFFFFILYFIFVV